MMPATLSIITNAFPPEERGKAIGTWAGVSAVALAIGPVVGGFLVENVSGSRSSSSTSRSPWSPSPSPCGRRTSRATRPPCARSTSPASLALSVGLGALVLGLVEGNAWGWGSPRIIGLFVARRSSALAAFFVIEHHVRAPMLDFSYFRSRSFLGANVVAFIVSFAMLAMFFFIALYMQNVRGYSPLEAGVRFLPSTVVIIFMGPIAGRLADKVGPRPLMSLGLVIVSISLFAQSFLAPDTPYATLAIAFVLMGIGHGPRDVADEHRRDERGRPDEGRRRLRRALDEPHGRRHLRRRRDRARSITTLGRSQLQNCCPRRQRRARSTGSSTRSRGGGAGIPGAAGARCRRRSSTP